MYDQGNYNPYYGHNLQTHMPQFLQRPVGPSPLPPQIPFQQAPPSLSQQPHPPIVSSFVHQNPPSYRYTSNDVMLNTNQTHSHSTQSIPGTYPSVTVNTHPDMFRPPPPPPPPPPPRVLPPPPSQANHLSYRIYNTPPTLPPPPPPCNLSYAPIGSFVHQHKDHHMIPNAHSQKLPSPPLPPPPPPPLSSPPSPPPLPSSPPPRPPLPPSSSNHSFGLDSHKSNISDVMVSSEDHMSCRVRTSSDVDSRFESLGCVELDLSPPPSVPAEGKTVQRIEVLCQFIVKHGSDFEDMARKKESGNPEFDFLFGGEPGSEAAVAHEYFLWMKRRYMLKDNHPEGNDQIDLLSKPLVSEEVKVILDADASHPFSDSDMDMDDDVLESGKNQDSSNTTEGQHNESIVEPLSRLPEHSPQKVLSCAKQLNFGPAVLAEHSKGSVNFPDHHSLTPERSIPSIHKESFVGKVVKEHYDLNPPGSPFRHLLDYASSDESFENNGISFLEPKIPHTVSSPLSNLGSKSPCMIEKTIVPSDLLICAETENSDHDINDNHEKDKHGDHEASNQVKETLGVGVMNLSHGENSVEDPKSTSNLNKVDEFGRLFKDCASDSDSDDSRHSLKHSNRNKIRAGSRSPVDRKRKTTTSPRKRNGKRSRSHSWSPRRGRSPVFRRSDEFGGQRIRRDRNQIKDCIHFLRGRCFHGASCRYLHHDSKKHNESRRYGSKDRQRNFGLPSISKTSDPRVERTVFQEEKIFRERDVESDGGDHFIKEITVCGDAFPDDGSNTIDKKDELIEFKEEDELLHVHEAKEKLSNVSKVHEAEENFQDVPKVLETEETSVDVPEVLKTEVHDYPKSLEVEQVQDVPMVLEAEEAKEESQDVSDESTTHLRRDDNFQIPTSKNSPESAKGENIVVQESGPDLCDHVSLQMEAFESATIDFVPSVDTTVQSHPGIGSMIPKPRSEFSVHHSQLPLSPPLAKPLETHDSTVNVPQFQPVLGKINSFPIQESHFPPPISSWSSLPLPPPPPPPPPPSSSSLPLFANGFSVQPLNLYHVPPPRTDFISPTLPRTSYSTEMSTNLQFTQSNHQMQMQMGPQVGLLNAANSSTTLQYGGSHHPVIGLIPSSAVGFEKSTLQAPQPGLFSREPQLNRTQTHLSSSFDLHPLGPDSNQQPLYASGPVSGSRFSAHRNPYASTFEHPLNSRFTSNAEKEPPLSNRYDTSFSSTNYPVWRHTQYDPILDSIEPPPSSSFSKNPILESSMLVVRSSGSTKLLDLEENSQLKGTKAVSENVCGENDEYGETADAEVGVVENVSPNSPIYAEDAAGGEIEVEIDQIKSPRKKKSRDSKPTKLFKVSLANFVKEILKPSWRQGNMSKEAFKTIVKKTVDKVSGAMKGHQIPKSRSKIDHYIDSSQSKLTKLVMGYVDKYVKV